MDNIKDSLKNLKNIELNEAIHKTPSWLLKYGNSLFLILTVLSIGSTFIIKYPRIIKGSAVISSKYPVQKIFTNSSGIIDSIFVSNKDTVIKNQSLAIIQNNANYHDIKYIKKLLEEYPINQNNLYYPIDTIKILQLGEIDNSYSEFENAMIQIHLLNSYKDFDVKNKSNEISLNENKRNLNALQHQRRINISEINLKKEDYNRHRALFEKGIISKLDLERKQIELLNAEKEYRITQSNISQILNEINSNNEKLALNNIDKKRTVKNVIKNAIQKYNNLISSIDNWEKNYLIKSYINGIVNFSSYYEQNQFIEKNKHFIDIVPYSEYRPLTKVKVPIYESGKIKNGQRVNIKLDNFPYIEYGIIRGKVSDISLVADSNNNYLIDVKLDSIELITTYNQKVKYHQEMIGVAEIITEDITLFQRIFLHLRSAF